MTYPSTDRTVAVSRFIRFLQIQCVEIWSARKGHFYWKFNFSTNATRKPFMVFADSKYQPHCFYWIDCRNKQETNRLSFGSWSHFSTVKTLSSNGTLLKIATEGERGEHYVFKRCCSWNSDIRRLLCLVWTEWKKYGLDLFHSQVHTEQSQLCRSKVVRYI